MSIENAVESTRTQSVDWNDLEDVRRVDRSLEFVPIDPLKRAVDVGISAICLVLCSPIFAGAWLWNLIEGWIKPEHRGPLLLRERRMSEGEPFDILKFRILKTSVLREAEQENRTHIKPLERDPDNLTYMGSWLKACYMDELPQLWNVLVGDMSLVGPRPWPIPDYEMDRERGLRRKDLIRSGLTGPAQIAKAYPNEYESGYHGDYDYIIFHATHHSLQRLVYDARILLKTIRVILESRGY